MVEPLLSHVAKRFIDVPVGVVPEHLSILAGSVFIADRTAKDGGGAPKAIEGVSLIRDCGVWWEPLGLPFHCFQVEPVAVFQHNAC